MLRKGVRARSDFLSQPSTQSQVRDYFLMPELYLMELTKRPCFIFYKLVESLIQEVDDVLVQYRRELLACEERTFKQVCACARSF